MQSLQCSLIVIDPLTLAVCYVLGDLIHTGCLDILCSSGKSVAPIKL